MFRNVSCFVSLDAAFYYSSFYDLLNRLIKTFAAVSIPQGIGNMLSLLECLKENIIKKGWAWFKLTTRETQRYGSAAEGNLCFGKCHVLFPWMLLFIMAHFTSF